MIVFPTRVIGVKNLPRKGRFILSCNHQSMVDVVIIALISPRNYKFMAKDSLFKNKFVSWFLTSLGAYPVSRGKADIIAVKNTLKFLKEERAICLFPEGTRMKQDEMGELKDGIALFASKTSSPIVPAYFVKKTKAFRLNILSIGEAFYVTDIVDKLDKENIKEVSKSISNKMKVLQKDYYHNKIGKAVLRKTRQAKVH